MDVERVANTTAAWVEAWLHGNAQPLVILASLRRLASQSADQPQAQAIVERGQRIVSTTPFGSISQSFAG